MAATTKQKAGENSDQALEASKKKANFIFPIILGVGVVIGLFFGIKAFIWGKHHVSTDDAQIQGDVSPVIPRVSGYVISLRIADNQYVKKGDTLLLIDQNDLISKVAQAEAKLENAKATLTVIRANVNFAAKNTDASRLNGRAVEAQVRAAEVRARRASQDFDRYANLIKDHSITQQQFEQAEAEKETAFAQLTAVKSQHGQASSQSQSSMLQTRASKEQIKVAEAQVKQAQVDLDYEKLQLSYTVVRAQESGIVSKRMVQEGQYVTVGQSLCSLVLNDALWVVANFKETQLQGMEIGQSAEVAADAFPDEKFRGTVQSVSGGTGASFALLPPDNSTGNFVKVVQRVPVKIVFNKNDEANKKIGHLRTGMNVEVTVNLDERPTK